MCNYLPNSPRSTAQTKASQQIVRCMELWVVVNTVSSSIVILQHCIDFCSCWAQLPIKYKEQFSVYETREMEKYFGRQDVVISGISQMMYRDSVSVLVLHEGSVLTPCQKINQIYCRFEFIECFSIFNPLYPIVCFFFTEFVAMDHVFYIDRCYNMSSDLGRHYNCVPYALKLLSCWSM